VLFNEPKLLKSGMPVVRGTAGVRFSALQRAEIAEIGVQDDPDLPASYVSVLFNEPKLLKSTGQVGNEMMWIVFQCSSTSRNC